MGQRLQKRRGTASRGGDLSILLEMVNLGAELVGGGSVGHRSLSLRSWLFRLGAQERGLREVLGSPPAPLLPGDTSVTFGNQNRPVCRS